MWKIVHRFCLGLLMKCFCTFQKSRPIIFDEKITLSKGNFLAIPNEEKLLNCFMTRGPFDYMCARAQKLQFDE